MPLDALLFDLDGTLVDSDALHFQAFQAMAARHGVGFDQDFFDRHMSGHTNAQICQSLFPGLPPSEHDRIADEKEALFRGMLEGAELAIPGVVELIGRAVSAGVRAGVVSNAPGPNVDSVVRSLGLDGQFAVRIWGGMVPRGKPDPLPYQAALERLGVGPDHAVAFEDTPLGIRAAVGAGIPTVGLMTTQPEANLLGAGAALAIKDYHDPRLAAFLAARMPSLS